ncbi:MAG: replication initiation protein [Thiolinea sp.]
MAKELAQDVKKHVAAIRISNDVGLVPRKMWNVLLLNAYDSLLTRQEHNISLTVLSEAIGFNSRNYTRLRESLEKLSSTGVTWDVGGKATEAGKWKKNFAVSSLLAWGKVEDGILTYGFSPILSELLFNPEIYQRISIAQQKLFKTSYGLALWENCVRYSNTGSTGMISVDEWRLLLGATAKTYDEYRRFSQKVLTPAVKEVNKVSNIEVKIKTKRTNRRVSHIGFQVIRKSVSPLPTLEKLGTISDSNEFRELKQHGITDVQAKLWIQEYGYAYIREKLLLLDEKLQSNSITSSAAGFLAAAIRNDYKSETAIQKASEAVAKARQQQAELKRKKDATKTKLAKQFEQQTREEFLNSLTDAAKLQLIEEIRFEKQDDLFIQAELERLGLNSQFVALEITQRIPEFKKKRDKFIKSELSRLFGGE